MELSIAPQDQQVLLNDKNVITETVLDKYRLSGQICQTTLSFLTKLINDSYHLNKGPKFTIKELCLLGDSYLQSSLDHVYSKGVNSVNEKGISLPVSIEVNEINSGFSPELDDNLSSIEYFQVGDIVKISLGCHIDGYTSNLTHTIVIYPQGELIDNELRPTGPLLGSKADSIIAAHIATETVIALLSCSLTPEKYSSELKQLTSNNNGKISGEVIRSIVDSIAESFGCVVVPGSRVRRIRRFLAGQAEGVVAEKEYKGVVWSERDQESKLLSKAESPESKDLITLNTSVKGTGVSQTSALPTDEFNISTGEVYIIDLKMASISEFSDIGLVTLQNVDNYTGKNHDDSAIISKPSIFIRDFAIQHILKLKTSRKTLSIIDKTRSVYPFKLNHLSENFPISIKDLNSIDAIKNQTQLIENDIKSSRLGINEIINNHLVVVKPIQIVKFLPLTSILNTANPTGAHGYDAENPTLPGLELPLPRLGISSLKLKSLIKKSKAISLPVAREQATLIITSINNKNEILRLTGGESVAKPSWVHSNFKLNESNIYNKIAIDLIKLTQDKRFGLNIKECQPMNFENIIINSNAASNNKSEKMNLD